MQVFILLVLSSAAWADLAPLQTHGVDRIPGSYFVGLKDGADFNNAVFATETLTGNVIKKFKSIHVFVIAGVDEQLLKKVRALDTVEYVEEDSIVRTQAVTWGLDRVDQRSLPLDRNFNPSGDGAGAHIYVIDTGINPDHKDFSGRASIAYDAIRGNGKDCNGHGTHCSGTTSSDTYGIAKKANVYGVRVLNCFGAGSISNVVEGMDWVAKNHKSPAVASMSLGGGSSITTDKAVEELSQAGVLVAVAAGNNDRDACRYSPAGSPHAITVGATTSSDKRSSFSNWGKCVDIFAPGSSITSTWHRTNTATRTISGTSMACPHVAGAAAVHVGSGLGQSETRQKLINDASSGEIKDVNGSPNLLLYIGQ